MLLKYVCMVSGAVCFFCVIKMLLQRFWGDKLLVEENLNSMMSNEKKKKAKDDSRRKMLSIIHVSDTLREKLELAQINLGPEEFVFVWIVCAFGPGLLFLVFTQRLVAMVVVSVICAFVPIFFLNRKISKQRKLFERQLGDALMVLANAIRAGFSFQQALANVASDLADPVSREFLSVSRDLQLGADLEESMTRVADRMDSSDLRLITTAVVIQRQVGGNLSEILDTISQTIRDRLAIKRTILALTAQGRISGKIIGAMPFLLLLIIYLTNPDYIMPLFTTSMGVLILIISGCLLGVGFFWINKIVDLKF